MIISKRVNNVLSNLLYTVLLLLTGYVVSYFDNRLFNGFGTLVWLIIFISLTFNFSSVRSLIVPLITFKPFKNPKTYLYMIVGIIIPYIMLKISVHYEILMDRNLIVYYKIGFLEDLKQYPLIEAIIFAPIWEELLFRGILLFALLKVVKRIWAVVITSIIFTIFHPAYLFISFIIGIIFACIAIRTKSVIPSMVTHSIWNLYLARLFLYL